MLEIVQSFARNHYFDLVTWNALSSYKTDKYELHDILGPDLQRFFEPLLGKINYPSSLTIAEKKD
jgi:hypothetical protein